MIGIAAVSVLRRNVRRPDLGITFMQDRLHIKSEPNVPQESMTYQIRLEFYEESIFGLFKMVSSSKMMQNVKNRKQLRDFAVVLIHVYL